MKTIPLLRALALVLTLTSTALHAQVPQIINYQGRVAVGDPPVNFDGSGQFKFALVNGTDGTSAAGNEPTAAVTLPVTKGLYSVLLGANMTPIPPAVFANPDVRLRVWFNDGANGSQLLTPDQRIAAVGYALMAGSLQPGTDISANSVDATGSLHVGSQFANGDPKLIEFGDLGFVSIGENSVDDQMELRAGKFVFLNGIIHGNGSGLTNLPAAPTTAPIHAATPQANMEAEWEYACRAGTATRFSFGDDPGYTLLTNYAWYSSNSGSTTHPVGQKAPNPWGLYDMHGNVFEWCQDSWDLSANYPGGSTIDPLVTTGFNRVDRGGSWYRSADYARCADRDYGGPGAYDRYFGFRAVLALGQ